MASIYYMPRISPNQKISANIAKNPLGAEENFLLVENQ
jgi:hypothetical protein